MGKADKAREVFVCQQVADEINRNDGADYCAVPSELEPPDVLLVSHSGKYPTRSAEVVSTPQDFTIRYDKKNVRNFERKLRLALQEVGFSGYRVSVHWSESAIRFGISDKLICALALITKTRAPNSGSLLLRGVEIYKDSPEVSRIAHYVSIFRLPYPSLEVHSACAWWAPRDGRWIEEAVTSKANKYGSGSFTANLMLVVDGLAYLDWEQMVAFRSGNPPEQIPFAELWVVTMGQAHRLKPSSEAPKAIQPT